MNGRPTLATPRWMLTLACLLALVPWGSGLAQTTTSNLRGNITGTEGQPVPGASVVVRNLDTNLQRSALSAENGFYYLGGLRPGRYELQASSIGFSTVTRQIQLLVGQTIQLDVELATQAVALEGIEVRATPAVETRTSEIATNVTPQQIQDLPTSDRNFLSLAQLAPGVRLEGDRLDATKKTISANGQPAEQINVFIDGASYKNDILKGGVAGQDASRGNPFPRNAVGEFRIITQNFKAEYQKAASAIITATTRSGTNEWQTNGFFNYQHEGLIDLDHFQRITRDTARARGEPFDRPDFKRYQLGLSAGGPLIRDRLFFFGSYEGNRQNRARRVAIVPPSDAPALARFNFDELSGEFDEPFRSTLFFGKLNYNFTDNSIVEFSYHHRHENDVRDFGGLKAYDAGTRFKNDVNTGILKHTWTRGMLLNEAMASFQRYRFNPRPVGSSTTNLFFGFGCCAEIGASLSEQDFSQKRFSLRNDLTYSGLNIAGQHVVKVGANLDFLNYDILKRNDENPRFVFEPWHFGFQFPHRVHVAFGNPEFEASNTQVGLYAQDDWSPVDRLTLNLGVRWDFESKMINTDYTTPQAVVDSITKYADRLFLPVDPDRYFANGDRDPFYGAIQPRLGFSYSLDSEQRTTIFGGWGIFYDRTLFDLAVEEEFALQHPRFEVQFSHPDSAPVPGKLRWEERFLTLGRAGVAELVQGRVGGVPEVKLLPNDLEPPKSQHFNIGVRRAFGRLAVSAAYVGVRGDNIVTFYWANKNFTCPERAWSVANCFQERRIPGYADILIADNGGKTWYDALQLKLDRPYDRRGDFGWGAGLAYTFGEREKEGFGDEFSFANRIDYPRQKSNDEKHRVVANWVLDLPWVWGIQFSGVATYGSGVRHDVGDRFALVFDPGGFEGDDYRNLDLRFRKDFPQIYRGRLGLVAEVFNAFNDTNLGCYTLPENLQDANFGRPKCVITDPRRLQLGLEFGF